MNPVVIRSMEDSLRAAGRRIVLRHAVNRWLEYAFAAWFIALLTLILDRSQGWSLGTVIVVLTSLGCACAGVASIHNLRYLGSTRRERALELRDHGKGGRRPGHG